MPRPSEPAPNHNDQPENGGTATGRQANDRMVTGRQANGHKVVRAEDIAFQIRSVDRGKHRASAFPTSAIQKDLWTYWKLHPKSPAYNTLFSCHITSPLNVEALKKCFQLFIDRHNILRATFAYENGDLVQRSGPQTIAFDVIDVSQKTSQDIQSIGKQLYEQPFDLEVGPLVRANVLAHSEKSHYLVVSMNHIVCDAWSMSVLLKELGIAYDAYQHGMPVALPSTQQYQRFVDWQRQFLASENAKQQQQYWQSVLPPTNSQPISSVIANHAKPSSSPAHSGDTHSGDTCSFEMGASQLEAVRSFCKQHRATLNTFFLAIFQVLCYRYLPNNSIMTGTPVTGRLRTTGHRKRKDYMNTIGCLINQVIVSTPLPGGSSFLDVVGHVAQQFKNAFNNQDIPFSDVKKQTSTPDPSTTYMF